MKIRKLLAVILSLVFILAVFASCGEATGTVSSGDGETTGGDTGNKATNVTVNVGEKYTDKTYGEIEYVSVNENFTDFNHEWNKVPEGYKVIQATFNFSNGSDSTQTYTAYDFSCYADDESMDSFFATDDSGFSVELSAGKKATGKSVYFTVPQNATHIILEYDLNFITDTRLEFPVK